MTNNDENTRTNMWAPNMALTERSGTDVRLTVEGQPNMAAYRTGLHTMGAKHGADRTQRHRRAANGGRTAKHGCLQNRAAHDGAKQALTERNN